MPGNESVQPYEFEATEITHNINSSRQIARIAGGSALHLLSKKRAAYENPYTDVPDWSVVLLTEKGPVRLERNKWLGPTLKVHYPESIHPLPEEVVTEVFDAEPDEIHVDFKRHENGGWVEHTERTGYYRLPETDSEGRHYWLEYRDSRSMNVGHADLEQAAVVNGIMGHLRAHNLRNIALHRNYWKQPNEEDIAEPTQDAQVLLADKFKRAVIAVADILGGAYQLTAPYEQGRLMPAYGKRSNATIAARFILNGYKVTQAERTPVEKVVDPGYSVIVGQKRISDGLDTIVAEAGLSTFYYSRGAKKWRLTRGLVLNRAATIEDLDSLLPA